MLLVVLIFLMLSTTYSRFTELQINLPAADAEKLRISADAMAAHQAVVNVLDAARRAGLSRLTFAAQTANGAPR